MTTLPANGDTGWGTVLNAAITAIDGRFTWTGGEAVANKVAASGLSGTTLPATLVSSSLTSVGTLTSLTVSGTTTLDSVVASSASFNLVNTTATTVNFAGAATALSIGAATGTTTVNNALVVTGNLTVNGTTTTVNSTTISVDDINVILGDTASPTDTSANGGGITLKGSTDKTINWVQGTTAWTSSEHFNLATGKAYYINGTSVLSSTTLGSGVTTSSLTSVGTIGTGTWQGTTVGLAYGGTGKTTAPAAMANLMGYTSTATAGGSTTLTNTSSYYQQFTGSSNQTIVLPVTSTLQTGWTFHIVNNSTGTLTVNSSGGNLVISVPTGTTAMVTCIGTSLTTAADWESGLTDFSSYTGTGGVVVLSSSPTMTSPSVTTSLTTGSSSFDLVNTTATTVNFAKAATTISMGAATGTTTVNNALTVTGTTILGPASMTQQTTAYTLVLTDQGKVIEMTNSSDAAITVPPSGTVNFPVGTQIVVVRNAAGKVSFAPGVGVTIRSDTSKTYIATQYSAATLIKRGTDEWYLVGNLSAS